MAMTPHVTSEQLERFRRGEVTPEETLLVGRHLAACQLCAGEARRTADLHALRDALTRDERPRLSLPLIAAAAVLVIVAAAVVLFTRRDTKRGEAPRVIPVARIDLPAPPIIAELRGETDVLRGSTTPAAMMQPRGEVIESDRPRFTWSAVGDARYVVSVFDARKNLVAESPRLREASWTPAAPLPRGGDYSWEVEIRKGDDVSIIPAPPAPPARFRVLDDANVRKIAATKDPFARGVLYARCGVRQRAIEELSASNDPRARRLLDEVRRW